MFTIQQRKTYLDYAGQWSEAHYQLHLLKCPSQSYLAVNLNRPCFFTQKLSNMAQLKQFSLEEWNREFLQ